MRLMSASVLFAVLVSACAGDVAIMDAAPRGVAVPAVTTSLPTSTTTTTSTIPPIVNRGVAVVNPGGGDLIDGPEGSVIQSIHQGIALGFDERDGTKLRVTTPCNDTAWIDESDVSVIPQSLRGTPGPGFDLAKAVVVLDPGHGGRDWGAVGATSLGEKEVNLAIAEMAKQLFESPHAIDWTTGAVSGGREYPGVARVVLTRSSDAADDGDYEIGLGYRSAIAEAAGADVMVSIHNNSVAQRDLEQPGTEIYYSVSNDESARLAGIIYEEMLLSLEQFDVPWTGGFVTGARARVDPETGDDYYGLLRRSSMPAVIAEGVFLTNPEEEALARTDEFRQAYAEAVYRAVVRFLTTDDPGSSINPPEPFPDDAGVASTASCRVPEQP